MSELKPPQKIYLQDYCEDYLSVGNTTWCDEKQNDDDIEYILQSEYDQLKAENERLIVALGQLYEACMCADIEGELSELINGEILDAAQQALNEVKE